MANHPSALKRHRQSLKRRARNRSVRSRLRTERKKFLAAVESGDTDAATAQLTVLQKLFQQAASRGVIHSNTASRVISRASAKLQA